MRTGSLPALVRRYLERSLSAGGRVPGVVRIGQEGEMRQRPGGRAMRFSAVEELAVDRIAFSWRARFPLATGSSTAIPAAGASSRHGSSACR